MYLKTKIINKNKLINKEAQNSKCQSVSDNHYVKEYYKKINSIIFNKIVEIDGKKLLFINVDANIDSANVFFIRKSFRNSNLPHINFDGNDETNFKIDRHWNEYGHKLVADKIIDFIKKNLNQVF